MGKMKNSKIQSLKEDWIFIGKSETGEEIYLPMKKSVIDASEKKIGEIDPSELNQNEKDEVQQINTILKNAKKRKLQINWVFVLANILFLILWYYMADLNKPVAGWIKSAEGEELANWQKTMLDRKNESLAMYTEKLPRDKAELEKIENNPKASKKELKKAKKIVYYDETGIEENKEYIELVSKMTPLEFKEYTIKRTQEDRIKHYTGFGIWALALILYFFTNRKPQFLLWKKNKKGGLFETADGVLGATVGASVVDSLMNFDKRTVVFTRWSDGMVTRGTDLTHAGANIILVATVLILYMTYLIMTLPIRVVINFFRNFIFYI